MKKKSDLNVFGYDHMSLYPSQWLNNIKIFFRRFKWAYQRVTKGYCDIDLWSLDYFYGKIFRDTLLELSNSAYGHPYYITCLEWQELLKQASKNFENAINEDNEVYGTIANRYYDEMQSYISKRYCERTPDGNFWREKTEYTDEEKYIIAREKWNQAFIENNNFMEYEKNKGFDFLKKYFFSLWD